MVSHDLLCAVVDVLMCVARSLRAVKLSTECVNGLRRKLDKDGGRISDTMLITVINLASSAVSLICLLFTLFTRYSPSEDTILTCAVGIQPRSRSVQQSRQRY